MSEEEVVNRFLNMIATEYDGGLAIQFKNQYLLRYKEIKELQQENKQLKEELANDIDRYEDTISYQLGFDKGKEYLQQRIDKAIEYIKENKYVSADENCEIIAGWRIEELLKILGGKENE